MQEIKNGVLLARDEDVARYGKGKLHKTRDGVAFQFRMGAGFPGDVNRTHPASIQPVLVNSINNTNFYSYGIPGLLTSAGAFRPFGTGDTTNLTVPWGILARPFPTQDPGGTPDTAYGQTPALGSVNAPPAVKSNQDVLRAGYIMVKVNSGTASVVKGGQAYLYIAASTGAHILGGWEGTSGSNIIAISGCVYNGIPDSNGVVELIINSF